MTWRCRIPTWKARQFQEATEVIPSLQGTRTACAQYRTATTSTTPANVTQGFTDFQVLSKVLLRCATELPAAPLAVV
jgi:hypothetical protein